MSEGNEVSRSNPGVPAHAPYVPSWCYEDGPRECVCGCHEGYHSSIDGQCLNFESCKCTGFAERHPA